MAHIPKPPPPSTPSVIQMYRESLKLLRHMCGENSPKCVAATQHVRQAFRKNMNERDPQKVDELKKSAYKAISTYLVYASAIKMKQNAEDIQMLDGKKQQKVPERITPHDIPEEHLAFRDQEISR
eukprot:gnl/Spiro4/23594_TR11660_c0_g1_i1.p1 gnl/Spiro4/23594_TR11660_c0_g1~~gnl/Spiro4/23594_TR11660_c0_g1_i1.p1  ORF type:complete len:125 (-),score=31.34 gnl/Spiro4/23594_TR11660_c0_g1_i1:57-431(-)